MITGQQKRPRSNCWAQGPIPAPGSDKAGIQGCAAATAAPWAIRKGPALPGHSQGQSERGTRGICRGRAGLGFLSCLPSPMWGLPLSFGFLHHWINVCSTWRPKSSAEAKMWAWGIPGGTGLAVAAVTAPCRLLCAHIKKDHLKKAQRTTH